MRALAFSLWVCALLASSPALGQRFTDAQGVYDMWYDWLISSGEPSYIWLAEVCDSAEEIYSYTGQGFGRYIPLFAGRMDIIGSIQVENRFCWLDVFPIFVGSQLVTSDSLQPSILSTVETTHLVSSILPYLSGLPQISHSGFFVSRTGRYLDPSEQYGALNQAGIRMAWYNAPLGVVCVEVRAGPYWFEPGADLFVTPETYHEITGRYPNDWADSQGRFIWLRDSIPDVFGTNVTVRVKEKW